LLGGGGRLRVEGDEYQLRVCPIRLVSEPILKGVLNSLGARACADAGEGELGLEGVSTGGVDGEEEGRLAGAKGGVFLAGEPIELLGGGDLGGSQADHVVLVHSQHLGGYLHLVLALLERSEVFAV
jgi:hypothetical protein